MRLVDRNGKSIGSDAKNHAEIVRLMAIQALIATDIVNMGVVLTRVRLGLGEIQRSLATLAETFGVRPTTEEIMDAVKVISNEAPAAEDDADGVH